MEEVKVLKKRGRKPKIIELEVENVILTELEKKVPSKRGRKPKNYYSDLNIITSKKVVGNELKCDIELNKELNIFSENLEIETKPNKLVDNIWLNKYKPNKLNNIIGNKEQILKIKKWLINYKNSSESHAAVISGNHGIGKNLIIKLVMEETGYTNINICSTSLKTKNIVNEIIDSYSKNTNLYNSSSKYAIILDNTESISLSSEKENILSLFKINSQHKYFPIIFISNLQHSKLINNLKKVCLDITLYPPSHDELKNFMLSICLKENFQILDDKIYYNIIKFSQSDIRRLIFILQDLYYTYGKQNITYDMYKEYQQLSQKKDIDIGIYLAAKNLLDNYSTMNDCLLLYETEKVLLPLTIYENYYRKLFKQKLSNTDILSTMANVTNSISNGDVIETNIYSDQNWFLQNIHGFYTCVDTSYIMSLVEPIKKEKLDYNLVFSADFNKTSSKNINKKKNILFVQSKFKNKNINDVLYINKILYELEKNKQTTKLKAIKKAYNLDTKIIQVCLKIDKTNEINTKK